VNPRIPEKMSVATLAAIENTALARTAIHFSIEAD
jgi:hypothetical protein